MVLEHEKLVGGNEASIAFYTKHEKPLRGLHKERHGNRSNDSRLYCHSKGHWEKDCQKRIASEDRRPQGSANTRSTNTGQGITYMAQVDEYSAPTLDRWTANSGASQHMTSPHGNFSTYYLDWTTVTLANNIMVNAADWGNVVLPMPSGDITLKDVLHISSLRYNSLLSLRLIQ